MVWPETKTGKIVERSRFGQDPQFNFVHAKCEMPVRHLSKELGIIWELI